MSLSSMNANAIAFGAAAADALFSTVADRQSQYTMLAQQSLSRGKAFYAKGDYDRAAQEFQRSIGQDPSSSDAPQTLNLLAAVYIKQNKPEMAIKTYKASIALYPTDDNAHLMLANIYFNQGQYNEAFKEYKTAVNINPTSSTNIYSLGQSYLSIGRYKDAEIQFQNVIRLNPQDYSGYYALGQAHSKEGRIKDAVDAFQKVVSLKKDFYNVHVDLGSAYADLGLMDKAREEMNILNEKAPDLAQLLSAYIDTVSKPKLVGGFPANGFTTALGPSTPVSNLDASLLSPNATASFDMVFIFNKSMDVSSVLDPVNWSISKTTEKSPGGAYNWGLPNSEFDVLIAPNPSIVRYEPNTLTATVTFQVSQNADGNGMIDPSHIDFKFSGIDAYGNAMDPSADEHIGVSLIV